MRKVAEESARGGFLLTLGNIISMIVSGFSVLLIARLIGPEQYGLYSLSTVIPSILLLLINPGINEGLIKNVASLKQNQEEKKIAKMVAHGLLFKTSLGILATLICFSLSSFFAEQVLKTPEVNKYLQIASVIVMFQAVYDTINSIVIGLDKAEYNVLITDIQAIVKAVLSSLFVIIGFGISGALSGHILSAFTASIISGAIFFFRIKRPAIHDFLSKSEFTRNLSVLIRYGFPLYISALLSGLSTQYESIVLAIFSTTQVIGNYRAAANFAVLLTTFLMSLATALFPAFSKLEKKDPETKILFRLSVKYVSILFLPIITLVLLNSGQIVKMFYGDKYGTAELYLSLTMIQYYLVGTGYLILGSLFNGLGETRLSLKVVTLRVLIFIVLAPVLLISIDASGLILALIISSFIAHSYALLKSKSRLQIGIDITSTIRVYLAVLIPVIPILILHNIFFISDFASLILSVLIYLITYLFTVPLTKTVSYNELEKIRSIISRIRPLWFIARPIYYFEKKILFKIQIVED